MIATNSNDFIKKIADAECSMLNNTEIGKKLSDDLLKMKLENNPNMSVDEWNETKQQFVVFLFHEALKSNETLMNEFTTHIYNELKAN